MGNSHRAGAGRLARVAAAPSTMAVSISGDVHTSDEIRDAAVRGIPHRSAAPRCLIPRFNGAIFSIEWKEAIWDRSSREPYDHPAYGIDQSARTVIRAH
jgi:hypothetical protein